MNGKTIIDELQARVTKINRDNGWFEEGRSFGDEMALLHSEVSEALECFRDGQMATVIDVGGKPIGMPSELADIFIRLLDVCERHGVDLLAETFQKLDYNASRGYRHGGKVL